MQVRSCPEKLAPYAFAPRRLDVGVHQSFIGSQTLIPATSSAIASLDPVTSGELLSRIISFYYSPTGLPIFGHQFEQTLFQ